jgi:hypothetical protein
MSKDFFGESTTLYFFYCWYFCVCTSIVLSLSVVLETVMVRFWYFLFRLFLSIIACMT